MYFIKPWKTPIVKYVNDAYRKVLGNYTLPSIYILYKSPRRDTESKHREYRKQEKNLF